MMLMAGCCFSIIISNIPHMMRKSSTKPSVPLLSEMKLARVIVLGGGSGQTLLSLLESPTIAHVTLVEIDQLLIESCRKYIDGVNRAFKDSRVRTRYRRRFPVFAFHNREVRYSNCRSYRKTFGMR